MAKKREYLESEVVAMLKTKADSSSQKELADEIGVSPQYVHDVLKNRRPPAGPILKYLGLRDLGKRYGK